MKYIICDQGTPEWLQARAGAITASEASTARSVMSKDSPTKDADGNPVRRKGDPTAEAEKYLGSVALERIAGMPIGEPPRAWVLDRGHELEAVARRMYEDRTNQMVIESGIAKSDCDWFGYSSDGLVEEHGLIEIKCPIDPNKIFNILRTGDVSEYIDQMQFGMWITGRQWCDFIMYVPALASVGNDLYVKRIERDNAFISNLESDMVAAKRTVQRLESFARNFKQQ